MVMKVSCSGHRCLGVELGPVVGQVHQMGPLVLRLGQLAVGEMRPQRSVELGEGVHRREQAVDRGLQCLRPIERGGARDGLVQAVAHRAARIEDAEGRRAEGGAEPCALQHREALHRELDALGQMLQHLAEVPGVAGHDLLGQQQVLHRLPRLGPTGEGLPLAGAAGERGRREHHRRGLERAAAVHGLQPFEDACGTLAGTDAHRHHAVLAAGAAQAVDDRGRADGAGGAQRVAQCDGAAVGVDLGAVELDALAVQVVQHGQALGGEGFVQFDPVQVLGADAGGLQRGRDGLDRTDAHDLGRHATHGEGHKAGQRRQVVALECGFADDDQAAGAIRRLRAVAGGDAALGGEHGLELGQAFERGVGAGAFVEGDGAGLHVDGAVRQVGRALDDVQGRHLGIEVAGLHGGHGALVRLQREGILRLAADLPLRGDLLGRQAHAVSDADVFVLLENQRAQRRLVAAHRDHRHRLDAAGEHHIGLAHTDAVGGHLHGGDARGAVTVDRHATHRRAETSQHRGHAGDVHALLAFGEGAADDGVFDRLGFQARGLGEGRLHHLDEQFVRPGVLEVAPAALADRQTGGGDDVGVLDLLAHGLSFQGPRGPLVVQAWGFSLGTQAQTNSHWIGSMPASSVTFTATVTSPLGSRASNAR
mmetsp:Transcript_61304/g.144820  ORF Transcript_61304/g.144820 Transcript_61304/m.144820 type:complete len:649 (+) Transcript_61304:25-1971(+)